RKFFVPEPPGKVPERIVLRAIGQEWGVDYRPTAAPWVAAVEREGNRLLIYGDIEDATKCKQALGRWLSRKAHEHLVPWLRRMADEKKFGLKRILVKNQRVRWASCSRHKTISLNQKLLFLPSHLVRYVFIHELCHTVYLNHSQRFWAFVHEHEPEYKKSDEELRNAWRNLPAWVTSAGS
ncbi:M48 family metallopeptidase, partial [bacterium]|nr:M48 family metallopeptidase [bacterium]